MVYVCAKCCNSPKYKSLLTYLLSRVCRCAGSLWYHANILTPRLSLDSDYSTCHSIEMFLTAGKQCRT